MNSCFVLRSLSRIAVLAVVVVLALGTLAVCQSSPAYQTGTVMDVQPHKGAAKDNSSGTRYDVSVKVGDTLYVVLVTAPSGSTTIEYKVGLDFPVLVEKKTMTFHDALSHSITVPILSHKPMTGNKSP